jgi:predicted RNA-binding Zn ribbon-like protein
MVNMVDDAPGRLASVRALLNTWHIPNDTRHPTDDLPALLADRSAWERQIPDIRHPADEVGRQAVTDLRSTLRDALDGGAHVLHDVLAAETWHLAIDDAPEPTVRWTTVSPSATGDALAIVAGAVIDGSWTRLRACPDCRWVFYDTSRNNRRTWCAMTATDGGRGCGSIAKTRNYRQRRRSASGTPGPPTSV